LSTLEGLTTRRKKGYKYLHCLATGKGVQKREKKGATKEKHRRKVERDVLPIKEILTKEEGGASFSLLLPKEKFVSVAKKTTEREISRRT